MRISATRLVARGRGHHYTGGFPIWEVSKLKGQSKRDGGMIFRSYKASQSSVYPIRDAILAVNHGSCPSLSSSGSRQWGESALNTSRLPGALSLLAKSCCTLPQLGAGDNRPMRFGLEFLERFDTGPHQLCGAVYSGLKASKSGVSGLGRSSSKCGPGRAPRCGGLLNVSGVVELLALVEGLAVIV